MYTIYLKEFHNRQSVLDKNVMQIAEGLLEYCGLQEVWDSPNGTRVFTVKIMPDSVPVADIYWEVYEPLARKTDGSITYSSHGQTVLSAEEKRSMSIQRKKVQNGL